MCTFTFACLLFACGVCCNVCRSVGCVLYELYTGKILFSGANNNGMLRMIMEVKGKFNIKMLKKAQFVQQHFDHNFVFQLTKKDSLTGEVTNVLACSCATAPLHRIGLQPKLAQLTCMYC